MTTENKSEKQEGFDATELNKAKNETVTTELHFDLLKQYAWFSSAVIGALIILIQLKVVEMGQGVYISWPFKCIYYFCTNWPRPYG